MHPRTPFAVVAVLFGALSLLFAPAAARAAAPWIYRDIVLPRGDVAVDLGFGYGHEPNPAGPDFDGWGLNLDIAAGVTRDFELGARLGFRLDDGGQATQADRYGRPFDTETYGTLFDRVSNPELHFRWRAARGSNAELGLELRGYIPTEEHSRFGLMFALPIALRVGILRLDTGVYVPLVFYDPTFSVISIPAHLWFQITRDLWLGPLLGLRVVNQGGTQNQWPLGFGLGVALNRVVDLKTWFLFPDINQDAAARSYGFGVALQVRID